MSIKIETILGCDGPCGMTYAEGDAKYQPGKAQRLSAKKEGWVQQRAKDYCKACAEKLGIRKRVTYSR